MPSSSLPSRDDIRAFLTSRDDGPAARRDIARHFGVKGEARAQLRRLLKKMESEGEIALDGKRAKIAGAVPPVAPIDIVSVDDNGDLEARLASSEGPSPTIIVPAREGVKAKPPLGIGDRALARLAKPDHEGAPHRASVIRRIGKADERFVAVIEKRGRRIEAAPADKRARSNFSVDAGDLAGADDGDIVFVEKKSARGNGPKRVRVVKVIAHIDDPGAFSLMALAERDIPVEFPAEVLAEARRARPATMKNREDLRDVPLFTIDPADAKDHDDACFAAPDDDPKNEGGFRVWVAIADVAFYVRPGSALDREARRRGNSTYLPDRVAPMLPEVLSTDLCSLREGDDRPCLAVELVIGANGAKRAHRFTRAMMRSRARLAYEDAQAIDEGGDHPIAKEVRDLFAAFRVRMKERAKRAPLDLDLPERKTLLDERGQVVDVVKRERFDAHRVIEEFMILANVAAAETLERAERSLIYRVHDEPDEEDIAGLRETLGEIGYSLTKTPAVRPAHLNQALRTAEARGEKDMVSELVLRAQRQAIYDPENRGHFGLNLPRYAHFTSPIRRYADLTVHRALIAAEKLGPDGQTKTEAGALTVIAEEISSLERRSIAAERDASDRFLAEYLEGRVGKEFGARIRGVTKFGLFVMLNETGADGFIPMRSLAGDYWELDENAHALKGQRTGDVWRLGQAVRVRLEEAAPVAGALRFSMLSDPMTDQAGEEQPGGGKAPRRSSRKASGRASGRGSGRGSGASAKSKARAGAKDERAKGKPSKKTASKSKKKAHASEDGAPKREKKRQKQRRKTSVSGKKPGASKPAASARKPARKRKSRKANAKPRRDDG